MRIFKRASFGQKTARQDIDGREIEGAKTATNAFAKAQLQSACDAAFRSCPFRSDGAWRRRTVAAASSPTKPLAARQMQGQMRDDVARAFRSTKSLSALAKTGLAALALSGCATTRYVSVPCLSHDQQLPAEPPKVKDKLTGQADKDLTIVAGSAVRLRAWGEGLNTILEGCREAAPK